MGSCVREEMNRALQSAWLVVKDEAADDEQVLRI
jgi:hypothetical protein